MLKITDVSFITSAASKSQFIRSEKPIIAVCGKSNVGKSSFINMLANRKKLARVSKDPGRTRLVNYFDFGAFILADLPGYGFAKVSKAEKARWARLMEDFFADRANCAHAFSLVDVRHDPTVDDVSMINFLYTGLIPFTVIATKADKVSRMAGMNGVKKIAATFKCGADNVILTSSQTRYGLDGVLERLEHIVELFSQSANGLPEDGQTGEDMKEDEKGAETNGGLS